MGPTTTRNILHVHTILHLSQIEHSLTPVIYMSKENIIFIYIKKKRKKRNTLQPVLKYCYK